MRRRALLAVLALSACGPLDVVVALVPDGGMRPPRGEPCTSNDDCAPIDFCERQDCSAPAGRCVHRPTLCEPTGAPVCGCNGVTYLNDCFRRAQGVTFAEAGECTTGAVCDAQAPCPDGAFCARLGLACGVGGTTGRCWWTPPACPGVGRFQPCGGGACVDVCAAVRAQTAHVACP